MKKIKIRKAKFSDAEFIAILGRVTFTETFGHLFREVNDLLTYYNKTFSVQKIRTSLKKSTNVFWIAFVDDLPVGYAKLKLNSDSEFIEVNNISQLQKIYVLKDFLSMKIGLKLQNKLTDEAQKNKSEVIWLSVLHSNKRAINFYKKNNFIEIGLHNFQIGIEHFEFIVMSKNLKD
jgi:ribosomal protein S18 acetylase RimI-like enzyme